MRRACPSAGWAPVACVSPSFPSEDVRDRSNHSPNSRHSARLTWALVGLTIGGTVKGDPVKEIVKVAYENGINMFDTAEAYSNGESERELCVPIRCPEKEMSLMCFAPSRL